MFTPIGERPICEICGKPKAPSKKEAGKFYCVNCWLAKKDEKTKTDFNQDSDITQRLERIEALLKDMKVAQALIMDEINVLEGQD